MNRDSTSGLDARSQRAVAELRNAISHRYPAAAFEVSRAPDDPQSIHLIVTVDVDDPDEVGDLVIDRVVEMQAEEGIPIHVIPVRPSRRVSGASRTPDASPTVRRPRTIPLLGSISPTSR
jgi:hypothetical protein